MVDFLIRVVVDPKQAVTGSRVVDRELKRVDTTAKSLGATFARVFAAAGLSIGIASSVRLLADFSQEMSTVQAVTNATTEEFAALREEAQRLGSTTRFSAVEAAQAMGELARAGFTADEALRATSGTLQLAQAGGLALARASEIASATLRGFRLEVEDLGRVNDVLAFAANASNTSVEGLGQALKFVAPVAAGTGVSIEETTAAIAALANAGLDASLAGTGLRRVISELENPTANSAKLLQAYGLTTQQVSVSQVGLTQALKNLAGAGIDTAAALEIFGDRGGPAFEVLSNAVPFVQDLTESLEGAAGVAARTAAIMDDNLNGSLLALRAAAQSVVLALGESGATGTLRTLVDFLARGLRLAADNIEVVSKALQGLAALFATKLAIPLLIQGLTALKVALLSNPITFLPTILLAGVAAVVAFREEIANFEVAGVRLGDALAAAFNVARDRFTFLVERVADFIPTIRAVAERVIDFFGTAFETVLGSFQQFANAFLPDFESVFGDGSGALGVVKTFANFTIGIFKTVGDVIQGVIDGMLRAFSNIATFDFSSPFESLKRITSQTFTDIGKVIDETLTTAQSNFSTDYVGAMADTGKAAALALTEGFQGKSGAEALASFLDFRGDFQEELAKQEGERVAQRFVEGAKAVIESVKGFFADVFPKPAAPAVPAETEAPQGGLSPQALEVLQKIQEPAKQYEQTLASLNELQAANAISAEEYAFALNEATIAANVASSSMSSGLAAGLAQVKNQLADVSGAVQQTVVNAFGRAEDAIVQFATTGEVNFSAFVDGLLADVARILARKALLALIDAFGGGAGGGIFGAIGGLFGGGGATGGEAEGGLVQGERPIVVGEQGPELFTPRDGGKITPAGETAARMANASQPVVNVTTPPPTINVVNVSDPSEIPAGIESNEGEQAIMNVIRRNSRTVKSLTG